MPVGILGRKCGMTRVFDKDGNTIPVSVVIIEPNYVTQVKTMKTDGYNAIQIATGFKNSKNINKAITGHLAKAKVESARSFLEFRLSEEEITKFVLGDTLDINMFKSGNKIDVIGCTKGKGFAGVIKRYNFSAQRASHGNSLSHRAPGSIGQNQTPGRVHKGKKMAGHLGDERVTIQNLEIVRIDEKRNVLLIKGAIPGAVDGELVIKPSIKSKTITAA